MTDDVVTVIPPLERPGLIEDICAGVRAGNSLISIAEQLGIHPTMMVVWMYQNHSDAYGHAVALRNDSWAHEALKISDEQQEVIRPDGSKYDPDVGRDTLRVNTRLKLIGRNGGEGGVIPGEGSRPIEVIHRVIIDSARSAIRDRSGI